MQAFTDRCDKVSATPASSSSAVRQSRAGCSDADPERIARILLAAIEGLQIRWLHEPDFDMVAEFLFTLEQFGIRPPELLTDELDSTLELQESEPSELRSVSAS